MFTRLFILFLFCFPAGYIAAMLCKAIMYGFAAYWGM